jgi:hypothetical protein
MSVEYRSDLPPRPARMLGLPLDHRGFPVPWFVAVDPATGERDFRVADFRKIPLAITKKLCWVCGQPLGKYLAFVIGPMCAVNRVTSEPPCHRACAIYSATACPFLSRPRMRRNEKDLPDDREVAGIAIQRNPGVAAVWITKSYKTFHPHRGGKGVLFHIGPADAVLWFAHGRAATRAEVMESIDSGLPTLREIAALEGSEAITALDREYSKVLPLLPA